LRHFGFSSRLDWSRLDQVRPDWDYNSSAEVNDFIIELDNQLKSADSFDYDPGPDLGSMDY
jgi:hypothetical protein